jgi:DNA polymerase III delta prime subunit
MISRGELEKNAVLVGDRKRIVEELKAEFAGEDRLTFVVDRFEVVVDDVRALRKWVLESGGVEKVVVLSSFYWNDEVQNALLKILEDTPPLCRIFLVGHSLDFFLPTVLSRVHSSDFGRDSEYTKLAFEVLSLPPHLRLQNAKLKKLFAKKVVNENLSDQVEDLEDEEVSAESESAKGRKDKESLILFFEALTSEILKKWRQDRKVFSLEYLKNLKEIIKNIDQYGGNPQLSIEYVILTTPKYE